MTDLLTPKTLVAAAAVAVLVGTGVAACQHRDDVPVTTDPCVGTAFAAQAPPAKPTKSASGNKNGDRPPADLRKPPRAAPSATRSKAPRATANSRPSTSSPLHGHGHLPHVDIDLELDGC
ncbi:hypothetical protein PV387_23095 [Streptomyces sp. ME02-6987-2C]|uniref:hypothetical protein n=1 Tax=unclassified Streptomyces TaxID=2593676 RepID=UPI0029B2524D|nr:MULTISPECIES: hypothetical protein [unclassified Streptomyces]MDX3345977.1 hypothetical protein [Streptomyces sp. ME02-6979A]MDX3368889.1 hypothetical protein [Streptomyces sp. ME02-6987-2C]MDX3407786.1 hypothetical protein [Streptomyces sp. ME02-6977A]MDX3421743.1 hypothetical protein [Streptomyces sp. ME02-6985-2c]